MRKDLLDIESEENIYLILHVKRHQWFAIYDNFHSDPKEFFCMARFNRREVDSFDIHTQTFTKRFEFYMDPDVPLEKYPTLEECVMIERMKLDAGKYVLLPKTGIYFDGSTASRNPPRFFVPLTYSPSNIIKHFQIYGIS